MGSIISRHRNPAELQWARPNNLIHYRLYHVLRVETKYRSSERAGKTYTRIYMALKRFRPAHCPTQDGNKTRGQRARIIESTGRAERTIGGMLGARSYLGLRMVAIYRSLHSEWRILTGIPSYSTHSRYSVYSVVAAW